VDDAFPLYIPGWQSNVGAEVRAAEVGSTQLKAEHVSKIEGLLFSLDELNQSLMMNFRGAYIAFSADPCGNADLLTKQVDTILREQTRFQMIRVQIRGLVALAASHPNNHDRILDAFQHIVQQLGGTVVVQAAAEEIESTRNIAKKWAGGSDER
jgi:hypothetical protein